MNETNLVPVLFQQPELCWTFYEVCMENIRRNTDLASLHGTRIPRTTPHIVTSLPQLYRTELYIANIPLIRSPGYHHQSTNPSAHCPAQTPCSRQSGSACTCPGCRRRTRAAA